MSDIAHIYRNPKLNLTLPHRLDFCFKITAAKTVSPKVAGYPVLTTFDAFASQAVIDAYLGTTNEFLLTAFDATSMGNDTFGGIINMWGGTANDLTTNNPNPGEVLALDWMEAVCYSSSGTVAVPLGVSSSTTLTASTLVTECAAGANGNIGFKCNFGNTPDFDGLTSGDIIVKLYFRSK